MFKHVKAFSGFAVDDIPRAREFYAETLGLEVTEANGMLTLNIEGDRPTLIYPKPDHMPATYTILNFPVDDIDDAVDALVSKGIAFQTSEWADEKGIMRGIANDRGPDIAWFTDPAGNVLAVLQQQG